MGAMTLVIPDEIEITFRKICTEKYGDRKGKLALGATEAIYKWIVDELPSYKEKNKDEDYIIE